MSSAEAIADAVFLAIANGGGVIVVQNGNQQLMAEGALRRRGPASPETYRPEKTAVIIESSVAVPEYRSSRLRREAKD